MPAVRRTVPVRPGTVLRLLLWQIREGLEADAGRWPLWLPVALGAGVLLYFALRFEPPFWSGGIATTIAALWFRCIRRSRAWHALAAGSLACCLGFAAAQWQTARMPAPMTLPKRAVILDGTVEAVDLLPDGGRRLWLASGTLRDAPRRGGDGEAGLERPMGGLEFRVRLRPGDGAGLRAGESVSVRAMLRPPAAPDWPGGRDGQRDAFFAGLGGSGFALGPVSAPEAAAASRSWRADLRRLRETVAARIVSELPGARGAVAATLLTGLGTAIPQADRDAFAASGLAHILAVAGLHLGIVSGLGLLVARALLFRWEWAALRLPCRQIAAAVALLFGAGYLVMTGLHLPGLRALAMAAVVLLALWCGRRAVSMRGLALAAALILLIEPAQLLDVAFQMSFAAVLALLAGYEAARPLSARLAGTGTRWHRFRLHLFQLFFTSLIAGAASLPFAAFHFGRVQFYFVLANLLAVPVTAVLVMPAGVLALLLMPVGLDRAPLWAMGEGVDLVIALARGVAAFPAASLPVPAAPPIGALAAGFGLVWLCVWRRRWRLFGALPLCVGLASPWLAQSPALLVSADAGTIAWRGDGRIWVSRAGRLDSAALRDWTRDWGRTLPPTPFPDATVEPALTCSPAACLLGPAAAVLLLRNGERRGSQDHSYAAAGIERGDCAGVALLVSPAPSDGLCPGVARIDRFTVWRNGPTAAWVAGDRIRVWTARTARGARPWVPADPAHHRPSMPLAQAE